MSDKEGSRSSRDRTSSAAASASLSSPNDVISLDEITVKDVVLGRGSAHSWRPGNVNFHNILDETMSRYQTAPTKLAKRSIIQQVYNNITIQQGGRFLEKTGDENDDNFIEIEEDEALTKIGCAIRYRKKRIRKAETEMMSQLEIQRAQSGQQAPAWQSNGSTAESSQPSASKVMQSQFPDSKRQRR